MKSSTIVTVLSAMFAGGMLCGGCAEEVSHHETDKPNILDNGRTHQEESVYRNPDGTYTTEKSKTRTSD